MRVVLAYRRAERVDRGVSRHEYIPRRNSLRKKVVARTCGYAAIIKVIWGGSAQEGSIKKLQVNMANIRKKLGDKPGEINYIVNELGVGYRLNG